MASTITRSELKRQTFPEIVRSNSLVVEAFDFNIYAITNLAPITAPDGGEPVRRLQISDDER
jgi:hypothetical protein